MKTSIIPQTLFTQMILEFGVEKANSISSEMMEEYKNGNKNYIKTVYQKYKIQQTD